MRRYLGRSATMGREKRSLDPGDADADDDGTAGRPDPKRQKVPELAGVVVEAMKVDSLQKLFSSVETIVRRVVSEEVERALAKLCPAIIGGSCRSPKRIEGVGGRTLHLYFRSRLSLPLFTGGKVEGEQGAAIHVVLLDASTGLIVTSGLESSAKLDIVVLEGDFNNEDDEDWTEEEFESHVVKEREGKRPLLTGELQVTLKEGVGTLGELTFTDNSSWIRSRKFRLGLKISSGFCEGVRIREAKTEAFMVKDHRGELYKKHYPPALKDEVWRLEKIGKDGSFHKRLNKSGICTVEEFLRLVVQDPQRLRSILGSGMSNKMWEILIEHAKTCVLSGKHYIYYSDDTRSVGAVFNNIYEFIGLISSEQFYSVESLADSQKNFADTLVKRAYDNWMHVVEYDGKALLNFKRKMNAASHGGSSSGSTNYGFLYNQQSAQPQLSDTVTEEHHLLDSRVQAPAYNGNQLSRYSPQSQMSSNVHMHQERNAPLQQNQHIDSSNRSPIMRNDSTGLVLVPTQQQTDLGFQATDQPMQPSRLNSFHDWREGDNHAADDFLTEDIRLRSHELLENEDMQQFLRVFSMEGAGNLQDDAFGFQSFMPSPCSNFNFHESRTRSSSVGWLKIKAALMWGIFVRKKAAQRKAQVVELDD